MKSSLAPMLPFDTALDARTVRWFSPQGCVVRQGTEWLVYVGGALVGQFSKRETGVRNVLLVQLSRDARMHLGKLAAAFELTEESLRLIRRQFESEGLEAIWQRHRGGSETKITPRIRKMLDKVFAEGLPASEVQTRLRGRLALRTVQREYAAWRATREPEQGTTAAAEPRPAQLSMAAAANDAEAEVEQPAADEGTAEDEDSTIRPAAVRGTSVVQHVGAWLLIAMAHRHGLHERAEAVCESRVRAGSLRIALDAVIGSLAVGQHCVEGVRRLATPSSPDLLRTTRMPSASWVRHALGSFSARLGGLRLHAAMAATYAQDAAANAGDEPIVFYIDNHLRPYTGKHVIRKGWRMQDKHVVAGVSDYYIHDQDGRFIGRVAAPHHGSITQFLTPFAQLLQQMVGPDQRILLAFDRAGSFPKQLAELRIQGFEFVTYERRPYPMLAASVFTEQLELDDETVWVAEAPQRNLRSGRGRVRRIAVRKDDGAQISILATSSQSAAWLVGVMKGRWVQENAFKHGVERWGINQLDGRAVEPYPPHTLIPNPARRRLDVALRAARAREGNALRELANLPEGDAKRIRFEQQLTEARAAQQELELQRPSVPEHAPVCETELADTLVRHTDEYKITIDTIRIVCANAETDLAGELAPHLAKPTEAKKVLANIFAAPGRVRVTDDTIAVTLMPAANGSELDAIKALCGVVNGWALTLPGDTTSRRLRFQPQV
jgi:hypothetical protein